MESNQSTGMVDLYNANPQDMAKLNKYVDSYLQNLRQAPLTKQQRLKLLEAVMNHEKVYDYDYIKCVLFPELMGPVRLPSRFSVPSAVFTHRFQFYIDTGSLGIGYVCLLPQDTAFACCYFSVNGTYDNGNPTNSILANIQYALQSKSTYIPLNYSQVRLLGASLRVSYTGSAEQEAGFFTGAHVYESEIGRVSEEIIDNGYFVSRGRPSQGTRLVWLPKDTGDFEYYDQTHYITDSQEATNQQVVPSTEIFGTGAILQVVRYADGGPIQDAGNERWIYPAAFWGHGQKRQQSFAPSQLMVTWRGLEPSKSWIRVDVERHFEGVPRTTIRDLVSTCRAKGNDKTMDALRIISQDARLFGHTIQSGAQIYGEFDENLADKVDLYVNRDTTGSLSSSTGSSSLALVAPAQGLATRTVF